MKNNQIKCSLCEEMFNSHSLMANHIRWHHIKPSTENLKISKQLRDIKEKGELLQYKVICFICKKEFEVIERSKSFPTKEKYYCSRSCANTRTHSDESKKKTSSTIKNKMKNDSEFKEMCLSNLNKNQNDIRCSSKGERELRKILKEKYGEKEVSAHNIIILEKNIQKSVDITIKKFNIIIEYDGIWHFDEKIHNRFKKLDKYDDIINRDLSLKKYCMDNKIRLLRVKDSVYKRNKKDVLVRILLFIEGDVTYEEIY